MACFYHGRRSDVTWLVDEDEEVQEATDRTYWEERGSRTTLSIADELVAMARKDDPGVELKYNKFYIGLAKDGKPCNYLILRPQKAIHTL